MPVVQAYCYTKYIGHLNLQFDSEGELVLLTGRPVLLDSTIQLDPWVESKLEKYQRVLQPYREKVGSTLTPLPRVDNQENLLGDLVADSMLAAWKEVEVGSDVIITRSSQISLRLPSSMTEASGRT